MALPVGSTLNNNLVASYDFEETQGTTLFDSSGNANHGTINGSPLYAQEGYKPGSKAFSFSDADDSDYIDCNHHLIGGGGDYATGLMLRVHAMYYGDHSILGMIEGQPGSDPIIGIGNRSANNGRFCHFVRGNGSSSIPEAASTSTYYDGMWHSVVAVKRGGNIEIWIDKILESTADIASIGTVAPQSNLFIGTMNNRGAPGSNSMGFTIQDACFWSRPLSINEISDFDDWLKGTILQNETLTAGAILREPVSRITINNNLSTLNAGAGLSEPLAKRTINHQLDRIDGGSSIHSLSAKLTISQAIGRLGAGAQTNELIVKRSIAQAIDRLTAGGQLHDVQSGLVMQTTLDQLSIGAHIHGLQLAGAIIATLEHLSAGAGMIGASVKLTLNNQLETLQAGTQLIDPVGKSVIIKTLGLLNASGQLYDPSLGRIITQLLDSLSLGLQISGPQVKLTLKSGLESLNAGAAVHGPAVKRAIIETIEHLAANMQTYDVQTLKSVIVSLDHLVAGAHQIDPAIRLKMIARLEALFAGTQLYDTGLAMQIWEVLNLEIPFTGIVEKDLLLTTRIEKDLKFL